jgi:hypothetical protein
MTQILIELYDALKTAGVPDDKAQAAAASVIGGTEKDALATKADLAEQRSALKADLAEQRSELKADLAEQRSELKADLAELRHETNIEFEKVRTEIGASEKRLELKIEQAKNETLRWFFAISLGLVGAIFSIVKFVH